MVVEPEVLQRQIDLNEVLSIRAQEFAPIPDDGELSYITSMKS